jgi:hypothetical protein
MSILESLSSTSTTWLASVTNPEAQVEVILFDGTYESILAVTAWLNATMDPTLSVSDDVYKKNDFRFTSARSSAPVNIGDVIVRRSAAATAANIFRDAGTWIAVDPKVFVALNLVPMIEPGFIPVSKVCADYLADYESFCNGKAFTGNFHDPIAESILSRSA